MEMQLVRLSLDPWSDLADSPVALVAGLLLLVMLCQAGEHLLKEK